MASGLAGGLTETILYLLLIGSLGFKRLVWLLALDCRNLALVCSAAGGAFYASFRGGSYETDLYCSKVWVAFERLTRFFVLLILSWFVDLNFAILCMNRTFCDNVAGLLTAYRNIS